MDSNQFSSSQLCLHFSKFCYRGVLFVGVHFILTFNQLDWLVQIVRSIFQSIFDKGKACPIFKNMISSLGIPQHQKLSSSCCQIASSQQLCNLGCWVAFVCYWWWFSKISSIWRSNLFTFLTFNAFLTTWAFFTCTFWSALTSRFASTLWCTWNAPTWFRCRATDTSARTAQTPTRTTWYRSFTAMLRHFLIKLELKKNRFKLEK